ncbi:MAG: hypothetical protein ABI663_14700 [Chryseolinea sp.]
MSRKEIAIHLLSEVHNNKKRIESKVGIVAKKMRKAEKKVHMYQQLVGSNTLFTIYIYGIDDIGVDYAAALWFRSDKGLCWATSGQLDDVVFYTDHFFERYAERYLKKSMSTHDDATREFYREYKVSMALHTEEIAEGVYKTQLPLCVGGLALGFHDRINNIVVYNTYVSPDLLYGKQINDVEAYREVNEALQSMNSSEWRLIGEAIKL